MNAFVRKKTVLAFAFLCVSFYLPLAFAASTSQSSKRHGPEAKQPSIQVKEPDYNFGQIMEGSEIEHEFTVANTGTEVLKIERVRVE